jgi:hypothetical protein
VGGRKQWEAHFCPFGTCVIPSHFQDGATAPTGSLGFDFFWGKSRHNPNYWRVRRVTNARKFRNGLKALKSKLRGVWNYYGVIGNSERNGRFAWFTQRLVDKWLNRRSQRRSYNMTAFMEAWQRWESPMHCVVEKPWPQARQTVQSTL